MRKQILIGAMLLAGLAACGGSDHDEGMQSTTTPPPPVAGDAPDKFAAQVAGFTANAPDDIEAFGLDDSPPTTPENTEPAPVGP